MSSNCRDAQQAHNSRTTLNIVNDDDEREECAWENSGESLQQQQRKKSIISIEFVFVKKANHKLKNYSHRG